MLDSSRTNLFGEDSRNNIKVTLIMRFFTTLFFFFMLSICSNLAAFYLALWKPELELNPFASFMLSCNPSYLLIGSLTFISLTFIALFAIGNYREGNYRKEAVLLAAFSSSIFLWDFLNSLLATLQLPFYPFAIYVVALVSLVPTITGILLIRASIE